MKKTMSKIMAALLVVAMLCSVMPAGFVLPAAAADNLITNGGFEDGESGWTNYGSWGSGAEITTAYKNSGSYSLYLKGGWAAFRRKVSVATGVNYVISYYYTGTIAVKDVTTGLSTSGTSTVGTWKQGTLTIPADKVTGTIHIELSANDGSGGYVDDVVLYAVKDPSYDGFITNGDFETGDATGWNSFDSSKMSIVTGGDNTYLHNTAGGWTKVYQLFQVEPFANYLLTYRYSGKVVGYFKANTTNSTSGLDDKAVSDEYPAETAIGTWQTRTVLINPGKYSYLYLEFSGGGSSTGYTLDDVSVVKVNGLYNGDFETGDTTGWGSVSNASVTAAAAKDGNYGLKVNSGGYYNGVTSTVGLKANTNYTISFDFKAVTSGKPMIYVKMLDANGTQTSSKNPSCTNDGTNWTHYTYDFNSGDNAAVTLQLCSGWDKVEVYFDNVQLKEVRDPSFDGYITNGDFECGAMAGWSGNATTSVSAANAHSGDYGVSISGSWKNINQTVTVEKNTLYMLSCYYKGSVNFYHKLGSSYIEGANAGTYTSEQWKRVDLTFNSGNNTSFYIEYCLDGNGGPAYLDDIKLVPISYDGYVYNGDFEAGTYKWKLNDTAAIASGYGKDGSYGLHVVGNSSWTCNAVSNVIPVVAGKSYTITWDSMRPGSAGGVIFFNKCDANGKKLSGAGETYLSGGSAWATYSYSWTAPAGVEYIYLELSGSGSGEAYFDNLTMEADIDPSFDGYITNGDFETGRLNGSWTSNAAKTEITADAAKDGDFGAALTSGTGDWDNYQALNATLTVEKNCNYILTFDHKGTTSDSAIAYVKNADKSADLAAEWPRTVPGQWSTATIRFNSGDNTTVNLQICVGGKGITRYFDNFKLVKVMDATVTGGLGSVSELDNGKLGVAFKFDLDAQVTFEEPYTFTGGAVVPSADMGSKTLVKMGAVLTNKTANADKLTLEDVDGKSIIDIEAEKVIDVTASTVSFAVRVINIPTTAAGVTIYARPYYVYNNGAEDVVVYATATYSESYDSINNRTGYADSTQWELYWSDEFGGNTLDGTKWDTQVTRKDNVGKDGSGNPVDNSFYYTNRPENVKVEDGDLVLTMLKENMGDAQYSSGYVTSNNTFAFTYGRLEFRAKLPYGKGVWPALWTMGKIYDSYSNDQGWPICGEIDILELIGDSNTNASSEANRTATHNLHWGADRSAHLELGSYKLNNYNNRYVMPTAPSADYHIYAIEWSYRNIKFFVDDV
ncbi:MAG: carbohydrate binding domain-containing protein [Clostridia bacterium]|nr:carbohydrate binding domain-containing protein [Clostridia bacterium]